jgi:ubiquitin carboxyl-terminal hydrolase 5/13
LIKIIFDYLDDDDDEPAIESTTSKSDSLINEVLLQQLVDTGFSVEACKKALMNTGNNNLEAAMNWIIEHQSDPDFDTPSDIPTFTASVS